MKPSDYKISLDILESQSQYALPMKKGDTARVVYITLREGGVPYEIGEDCFAILSGKKPDGTVLENNCVISGNTIIYEITPQTTAVSGLVDCEIKLYGADSALITSARFSIIVDERVVGEDEIESTAEYLALANLYSDINTKMLNGDFKGDKGDKGEQGEKGEQGIQGEKGEKGDSPVCDTSMSDESENPVQNKVMKAYVDNLDNKVAESIGEITYNKDITDTLSVINGWYHKDTGVLNSQTNAQGTEIFQVAAGEKYYITGVYGYYACLIAEYDETQTFIQPILTAESNTIATDYEYIVPEGVSYIACSSRYVSISELVVKKEVTEYTNVIALKEELEAKIENTNEGVAENAADIEEIKSLITHAKNLYNPENDVYAQRAELNTSTGTLGMGSDYNVRNSEWIKVEPLTTYFLSHCNSTSVTVYCAEKDADDNIVTTYVFLNITSENGEGLGQVFTTQETTSYFKFSVYTNAQNDYISSFMLEEHHVGTSYEKYKEILNYKEYLPMAMQNQWKGKHLVVDGDSITHSFKDSETNRHFYWQFVVTELLDMWLEVSRKSPSENSSSGYAGCGWRGIGGSTIANEAGCNDEDVSIVLRYQNYPDDADLLIIAGGSNDWAHGKTLIGDFDSMDDTTFNGALNILLPALKEKYPTIPIIMMTPIKRGTHGATVTVKDAEGNDVLQTQEQFVNALIAKCRQYGVYCLDMWSVCRLDPTVDSMVKAYYTRLASDGVSNDLVHPDKAGQEVMGKTVAGFLKSIIP